MFNVILIIFIVIIIYYTFIKLSDKEFNKHNILYRLVEKLDNFQSKFIFTLLIFLAILYNVINLYAQDLETPELKYFNIFIFLAFTLTFFHFIYSLVITYKSKGIIGSRGSKGIKGQEGKLGEDAKCTVDCGKKVCLGMVVDKINKHFNYRIKFNKGYLKTLVQDDISAALITYDDKSEMKIRFRENYLNSELGGRTKKITSLKVFNDYEIIIKKKNIDDVIKLKRGTYDIITLNTMGLDDNDIKENNIEYIEINSFINNRFLINKINFICNTENYQQILRRRGSKRINEYKLINYIGEISSKWVDELLNFMVSIKGGILYVGIRFLREANFTLEMLKNYKKVVDVNGENTAMNCLYFGALNSAAWLARNIIGDQNQAKLWYKKAEEIKQSVQKFMWLKKEKLFKDGFKSSRITQQTQVYALKYGIVEENYKSYINYLSWQIYKKN